MVNICDGKVLVFMACALFCNASAKSRSRGSNGSTHPLNVVIGRSGEYHSPLARKDIGDNDDDNGFSLFRLLGRNVVNNVKKAVSILRPKIRGAIALIDASEGRRNNDETWKEGDIGLIFDKFGPNLDIMIGIQKGLGSNASETNLKTYAKEKSHTEINGKSDKIDSKILRKEEMTSTGEPSIADYFEYQEDPEELDEVLNIHVYYPDDPEETADQHLENQDKYLDTERELDPPTLTQLVPSIKNAPDAIEEYEDQTIIKTLGKDLDTGVRYQPGSKSTTKKQITHRIEPITTESTPVPASFTDLFTSLKEEVETDDPRDAVDRLDQIWPGQPRANWIFPQETTTEEPGYIESIAMGVYDHAIGLWNTLGK